MQNKNYSSSIAYILIIIWLPIIAAQAQEPLDTTSTNIAYDHVPEIDSIQSLLTKTIDDTTRVRHLTKLAFVYCVHNTDSLLHIVTKAETLAKNVTFYSGLAEAMNVKAMYYIINGNKLSALATLEEALGYAKKSKNPYSIGIIENMFGYVYNNNANYEKALEHSHRGLAEMRLAKDTAKIVLLMGNIGGLLQQSGNFELAETYFEELGEIGKQKNDINILYTVHWRLYNMYLAKKEYPEAEKHCKSALKIAKKRKNIGDEINMNFGLFEIYKNKNLPEAARAILHEANKLIKTNKGSINLQYEIIYYSSLAELQLIDMDYKNTLQSASKGLELSIKSNTAVNHRITLYECAIEAAKKSRKFETALFFKETSQSLIDSIKFGEQEEKTLAIERKYQQENNEIENKYLKEQQEINEDIIKQKTLIISAYFIGLILLSCLAYLLWLNVERKKKYSQRLEVEVLQRTKDIENTNKKLKHSNEELERFAYVSSHDLKEPVRNIGVYSELLKKNLTSNQNTEALNLVDIILKQSKHMEFVIHGIFEYSKVSKKAKKELVDLSEVILLAEEYLHTSIKDKNAIIISQDLPKVMGSKIQFFQVFKNIIENGIKYNTSDRPEVIISYNADDQNHIVSIQDNGIGIKDEYQKSIFTLFKRLQNREKYYGVGLGLSIVQKIIKNWNGHIIVNSKEDEGSRFTFTIPLTA